MDSTKKLLRDRIKEHIELIDTLDPESEEYEKAMKDLATLYKLKIDEDKNDQDFKVAKMRTGKEFEDLDEKKKDRWWRFGAEMVGVIVPLLFYGWWMTEGFKFEKDGTFTSMTFKGLTQKFKPTRK